MAPVSRPNTSSTFNHLTHEDSEQANTSSTAPERLSLHEIEMGLSRWMHQGAPEEKRLEAKENILNEYENNSPHLALNGYNLTTLPPEIGQLTQLTELSLSHNNITSFPPEIQKLTNLSWLILDDNDLSALPQGIELLPQLEVLCLNSNNFTTLPPEIAQLTQLTMLDLYNNNLTELPPTIAQLTNLSILVLGHNRLTRISPEINQLTQLNELNLNSNYFTSLPPQIINLPALQELDLSGCHQLRDLPSGFERLPADSWVNLQDTGLSANVLEAASRAVTLVRTQSQGLLGPQVQFSLPAQTTRAVMPLDAEIFEWIKEVIPNAAEIPTVFQNTIAHLPPPSAHAMATLLMRLRKTGQYTLAPQTMASRVLALLSGLIEQPSLLETFCAMALESSATCDDRTALGMLNMELALLENKALNAALSSTRPPQAIYQQLFELAQGVFKQHALMDIAHQHAKRASGYVDETEIVLKYLTHLGRDLQLPVQWDHMLYERFAFQVSEDDLSQARARLLNAATLDNPEFVSFMTDWPPFHTTFQQIQPQAFHQIERTIQAIKHEIETAQEDLFEQYEQACVQHGDDSEKALSLCIAMNQNSERLKPRSQAAWRREIEQCLGYTR